MNTPIASKLDAGVSAVARALREGLPLVAVIGQSSGWTQNSPDPVLIRAFEKTNRPGSTWAELLGKEPLSGEFYEWLTERFMRRAAPRSLEEVADMPLSAVFTSTIDPGLASLLSTNGRAPETILLGNPVPSELRSTRRPPIFYLFGRSGVGIPDMDPPNTRQALIQRQFKHASAMLRNLTECATPLGLILIDGITSKDWLKIGNLLAELASAPTGGVVWFGAEPQLNDEENEQYLSLVNSGIILREERSLGETYAHLRALEIIPPMENWDDPEIISLPDGQTMIITPKLRLITEATASIVDNSWTAFLAPLPDAHNSAAFQSFHAANLAAKALIEGIRRGYSFERDFEISLRTKVEKALQRHHEQNGAIIIHGQSGVGKTIALGRLAIHARSLKVPVLLVVGGVTPQPAEIAQFLEAAGQAGAVTLLLIDANNSYQRYDEILLSLRSRGNKVVVVGTSYRQEAQDSRFISAPSSLSITEHQHLNVLSEGISPTGKIFDPNTEHALAKFYWSLPDSRSGMADGLSREARYLETALRLKETRPKKRTELSGLAIALVAAGYNESYERLLESDVPIEDLNLESPAAKLIDYVMVVSRLYKAVPINLLLRTILAKEGRHPSIDIEKIRDLFVGEDMFRWREGGRDQSELVVQSRLQIEAELVCNRRLGTAAAEAACIRDLLANAYRAGVEGSEDAHFATDIVYALGPDGPAGERFRESYLDIARCLTMLRQSYGVRNARLMLQESTLRRAYIRAHDPTPEEKAAILEEATRAVNEALAAIDAGNTHPLYAAKRTREYLLTERAATYGFLAADSAKFGNAAEIWATYRVARDAAMLAAGKTLGYQPLDIALWVPIRILKVDAGLNALNDLQRAELKADIRATLDQVDIASLPREQKVNYERQRLAAGEVLDDIEISDSAFNELDLAGSPVGYYLRARKLSPDRPDRGETASESDISAAHEAVEYLTKNYPKISSDPRALHLLFSLEWLKATGRWIFRGLRQPLPSEISQIHRLRSLISDIALVEKDVFSAQYRYVDAVLNWLSGNESYSFRVWRALAKDTEYVEAKRVTNRHTISDSQGKPIVFSGVVVRSIGAARWVVKVNNLDREIDLQEADFPNSEILPGREVKNFAVSFNYRGAIADAFYAGVY